MLVASGALASSVSADEPVVAKEAAQEADGAGPETREDHDGVEVRARAAEAAEVIYDQVQVVGSAERAARIPGSVHVIDTALLERYGNSDIHRILRQVPGVNVQEEDGFGLRPNIGIRGTGVERSQKILLLEDGVPIAPAPYAAPAAYYSPTAGRMNAIEVRKGTATLRQGAQTNGGAINYVSTAIPTELGGQIELAGGGHGTGRLHANFGGGWNRFAFLVETYQHQTDGFKDLDGGGDTGFEIQDYLVKLRWNSKVEASVYQLLELKLGRTDQEGEETYLGLTRDDFDRTPLRRYAGSQEDRIDTEHEQVQLQWLIQPTQNLDIVTTFYRNDFFRNWRKNESTGGVSNQSVLADPASFATELAYLRGELDSPDDVFRIRNNRRDYYSEGVQSVLSWRLDAGGAQHRLQAGVRLHRDEEDRFQEEDGFAVRGGRMVLTSFGAPGSQANRLAEAEARAFFVEDEIDFGRLVLTAGVRFESVDTMRTDWSRSDPTRSGATSVRQNEVEAWIPGLGLTYQLDQGWTVFGSVHRGFSPPGPSSREPVEPEDGVNYEVGGRWHDGDQRFEIVGFLNDYDNLLGSDTASGGGTGSGDQFNGGEVEVRGFELSYQTLLASVGSVEVPLRVSYTYTDASFRSSFSTSFADWRPEVTRGDELPYVPGHQLFAEIGLTGRVWSTYLGASYVDDMRTHAGQGAIPEAERIEDHLVFDLGASYTWRDRYRFFGQVRNLVDQTYVVARRPYGLRPGLPRTVLAGLALTF